MHVIDTELHQKHAPKTKGEVCYSGQDLWQSSFRKPRGVTSTETTCFFVVFFFCSSLPVRWLFFLLHRAVMIASRKRFFLSKKEEWFFLLWMKFEGFEKLESKYIFVTDLSFKSVLDELCLFKHASSWQQEIVISSFGRFYKL
jgi:hypothetical protein